MAGEAGEGQPSGGAIATARALHDDLQECVLWVLAVVDIEISTGAHTLPSQEQRVEVLGTVVDPSGLTVVSATAIDPSISATGRRVQGPSGPVTLEAKSVFKEVKLLLADGTEVPAKVVMKDVDLDLAFVYPDSSHEDYDEEVEFTPVELGGRVKMDVLDEVVVLGRLDRHLDRRPVVELGRVVATVKKPRRFVKTNVGSFGTPTFSAAGELIGINVRRMINRRPGTLVTLPAKDVKTIADQALANADKAAAEEGAEKGAEEPEEESTEAEAKEETKAENSDPDDAEEAAAAAEAEAEAKREPDAETGEPAPEEAGGEGVEAGGAAGEPGDSD